MIITIIDGYLSVRLSDLWSCVLQHRCCWSTDREWVHIKRLFEWSTTSKVEAKPSHWKTPLFMIFSASERPNNDDETEICRWSIDTKAPMIWLKSLPSRLSFIHTIYILNSFLLAGALWRFYHRRCPHLSASIHPPPQPAPSPSPQARKSSHTGRIVNWFFKRERRRGISFCAWSVKLRFGEGTS